MDALRLDPPSGSWDIPNRPEVGFQGFTPINAHRTADRLKDRHSSRDAAFPVVIGLRPNFPFEDRFGLCRLFWL